MARKQKKYHYLYKTTNDVSGKYYYGMHSTHNLDDGYLGSGKRLRYSINKYGKENHSIEILEFFDNRKLLIEREKEVVNLNEIAKVDCMNLRVGGEGGLSGLSEDIRKKIRKGASNFLKNKWKDESFRKKINKLSSERLKARHERGEVNQNTFEGRKHSKETKRKMSESSKGNGIGMKNSQFGTCWITNENENRKLIKGDLIPIGWKLGRKT